MTPSVSSEAYDLWVHTQASLGETKENFIPDGATPGLCRFCGLKSATGFKNEAHLIPEGLGNKWLFSKIECDACNQKFGRLEADLCASIGPVLTVGGVEGKNGVRQTGRTATGHHIKHLRDFEGKRKISFSLRGREPISSMVGTTVSFTNNGMISLVYPSPVESFVPRNAYKALCKIGLSLLPESSVAEYSKLLSWVQSTDESLDFPFLDVGISVGSVGNSPKIASASLLRRKSPFAPIPHAILIVCAGSICWQIDLMADLLDRSAKLFHFGMVNFKWKVILGEAPNTQSISYDAPTHFDWSNNVKEQPVVQRLTTIFDTQTGESRIAVGWRDQREVCN